MQVTSSFEITNRAGQELTVTGGDDADTKGGRFLEFRLAGIRRSVRLEWSEDARVAAQPAGPERYTLSVNGGRARAVVARHGLLFDAAAYDREERIPLEIDELAAFGKFFIDLDLDGGLPPGVDVAVRAFGFGDWASCLADFAGAGAGLGSAGGLVAGGVAGAGAGAAIGGAFGGAFGLGYCTTKAALTS